jgi:hypothetical protein
MLAGLLMSAAVAGPIPVFGVDWAPLSRSDLTMVEDGRTSGLGVGEFDGLVRPSLSTYGGAWFGPRVGLMGTLGIARLQSTTWTGDVYEARHWGVVRPGVDLRVGLTRRIAARPTPWVVAGVYGDIPSARDVSNGYDDDEQAAADTAAYEDRLRLGGFGARLGVGAEIRPVPYVSLGLSFVGEAHWGVIRSAEAGVLSSLVSTRTSLLVAFEWPGEG